MDFVELEFQCIGGQVEGERLIDEINSEIRKCVEELQRPRRDAKAVIAIRVEMTRKEEAILVDGKVKTTPPARLRRASLAILGPDGTARIQTAVQQNLWGADVVTLAKAGSEKGKKE